MQIMLRQVVRQFRHCASTNDSWKGVSQAAAPVPEVLHRLDKLDASSAELLRSVCEAYAERVAFRVSRAHEVAYGSFTFREVWDSTVALATGGPCAPVPDAPAHAD